MRQRLDNRRMHGQHRIEEMGEADPMRFRHKTKQISVAVEAPRAAFCRNLDTRLIVPIEQLVGDLATRVLIGELEGFRAEPLRVHDGDQAIWQDAVHRGVGSKIFELAHIYPLTGLITLNGTVQVALWTQAPGASPLSGSRCHHESRVKASKVALLPYHNAMLDALQIEIDELMQLNQMSYADAAAQASGLFDINLNAPIHEQYFEYLGNLARGDLGNSFLSRGTSVMSIILSVLPWTLFAVGTGLLLSFVLGIGLGLIAAYRRNSLLDHAVSTGGSIISSIPGYLIALLIVLIFGIQLRWIPITQMRGALSPGVTPGFTPAFVGDVLFHASLPIAVFFLTHIGLWILSMRSATLAALEEDHVTMARARGLTDGRIATAYVGRNALLPLVSQFAIAAGAVVGGAVIIEQVFVYPGVGLRLVTSVNQRDYPLMQGIILMTTVCVIIANLLADLLYSKLDPRIGRAGGATGN